MKVKLWGDLYFVFVVEQFIDYVELHILNNKKIVITCDKDYKRVELLTKLEKDGFADLQLIGFKDVEIVDSIGF